MVSNNLIFWLMAGLILGTVLVTAWLGVNLLRQKRTEKVLAQRVKQLLLLNEIGGQIIAVLDLDRLFEDAVDLVREKLGYDHVAILTVDREHNVLRLRALACLNRGCKTPATRSRNGIS